MFAKARQSDMDLQALGQQLAARKAELMGENESADPDESPRSRRAPARDQEGTLSRLARRVMA